MSTYDAVGVRPDTYRIREEHRAELGVAAIGGDDSASWMYGHELRDGQVSLVRLGRRGNIPARPAADPFARAPGIPAQCEHGLNGIVIDGCQSCALRNRPERMARASAYTFLASEIIEDDTNLPSDWRDDRTVAHLAA